MDQDGTWHTGGPRSRRHCWMGTQHPTPKGAHPQFLAHVYCGQTAGWMKMPLGTEVDLGPGHVVLYGDAAPPPREKGTSAPLLFLAHVYCGHGRPSQLLLSSCIHISNEFCIFALSWKILNSFDAVLRNW